MGDSDTGQQRVDGAVRLLGLEVDVEQERVALPREGAWDPRVGVGYTPGYHHLACGDGEACLEDLSVVRGLLRQARCVRRYRHAHIELRYVDLQPDGGEAIERGD